MSEDQAVRDDPGLGLTINGKPRRFELSNPATIRDVISMLNMQPDRVAVEHNGRIARRSNWAETAVREGDRLEVVHFVGGGSSSDSASSDCR